MTNPTPPGQVPDALRLADECGYELAPWTREEIAAELLRLHAENEALRAQQDDAYDHGPQTETVEEAARDVGKWLNERPNRPLDLRHVAMLTHHAKRTAHVQNPAEIEHVAGDVSKNGAEVNTSTQQPAPAGATPAESVERIVHLRAYRERRIYVAGPMTGLPEYNFPLFNSTAVRLRSEGWHVENPSEHGHIEGAGWADYLRWDISRIATCGAIYLLPGWSNSKGATLEVHIAGVLGLEVLLADGAEAPTPQPAPAAGVTVEQVEDAIGLQSTAWDTIGAEKIVEAVLRLTNGQAPATQQAASSAVLKAIREANMQLVRTGDNAFMLVPYKVATAQAAESVPAPVLDSLLNIVINHEARATPEEVRSMAAELATYRAARAPAESVPAISDLPPLPDPDLRDVGTKPQEIKEFLNGYATEYARTAIAARATADSVPAWANQAVIEYRYTGGTHWCPLGPAERMKPNFDGVFPVDAPQPLPASQGDGVPTWQAAQDPMLECSIQPRPLSHPLAAYHSAMSKGPLHYTWQDKPHRFVYDLIAAVKHYANQAGQAAPAAQGDALDAARYRYLRDVPMDQWPAELLTAIRLQQNAKWDTIIDAARKQGGA